MNTVPGVENAQSHGILMTFMPRAAMSRDVVEIRSIETPGPPNPALMSAFALLLTAQVGLTLLLLILLLAKIRRAPALYNFIFITWLSVPIYLLLFYTKQYQVSHVREDICAVQAILKHGVDSAFVCALFFLALESWWLAKYGSSGCTPSIRWRVLIIGLPYVNFLGCSIAIFVRGETYLVSNYDVVPYSFYCTLNANGTVSAIETAENAVIILVTLFYEVRTALVYRKLKKVAATLNVNNDFGFPDFVRLGVFTFWLTIGLLSTASGFVIPLSHLSVSRDISLFILVTTPLAVCLVFSTQNDIISFTFRCQPVTRSNKRSAEASSSSGNWILETEQITFSMPDESGFWRNDEDRV